MEVLACFGTLLTSLVSCLRAVYRRSIGEFKMLAQIVFAAAMIGFTVLVCLILEARYGGGYGEYMRGQTQDANWKHRNDD